MRDKNRIGVHGSDEETNRLTREQFRAAGEVGGKEKRQPSITRTEFRQKAQPIMVTIDGNQLAASPKEMTTGSLGWHVSAKIMVKMGDKTVEVIANLNLPIIGSKNIPKEVPDG